MIDKTSARFNPKRAEVLLTNIFISARGRGIIYMNPNVKL